MILEKLYIDGFGKFSDYSLNFSPSIQILYGENEAGKSTIHAFIQAMLYGIPKGASKKEVFPIPSLFQGTGLWRFFDLFPSGEKLLCTKGLFTGRRSPYYYSSPRRKAI